jgi:hypothetical protein
VSNAGFKFKIAGKDEPFIQHTASVDRGSSGGPLFAKGSLDVLGINTLSIPMDANLYCAIPDAVIASAIDAAGSPPDPTNVPVSSKAINATCSDLLAKLTASSDPPDGTASVLSDYFVADQGISAWLHKFEQGGDNNDDARNDLRDSIGQGAVMTYLRPILLGQIYDRVQKLGSATCTEAGINPADLRDYASTKQVRQRIDFPKNKFFTLFWKVEQGHWRLASVQ